MNSSEIIKEITSKLVKDITYNVKFEYSKDTLSCYMYKTNADIPMKILRVSDHNPHFLKYIRGDHNWYPSSVPHSNISIEFFTPGKKNTSGKRMRNKINNGVNIPEDVIIPAGFSVDSISYLTALLTHDDIDKIYNAILEWANSSQIIEYNDPLINTKKQAVVKSDNANIKAKPRNNITESILYKRIMKNVDKIVRQYLDNIE